MMTGAKATLCFFQARRLDQGPRTPGGAHGPQGGQWLREGGVQEAQGEQRCRWLRVGLGGARGQRRHWEEEGAVGGEDDGGGTYFWGSAGEGGDIKGADARPCL